MQNIYIYLLCHAIGTARLRVPPTSLLCDTESFSAFFSSSLSSVSPIGPLVFFFNNHYIKLKKYCVFEGIMSHFRQYFN
jgi:hypothetical protein